MIKSGASAYPHDYVCCVYYTKLWTIYTLMVVIKEFRDMHNIILFRGCLWQLDKSLIVHVSFLVTQPSCSWEKLKGSLIGQQL